MAERGVCCKTMVLALALISAFSSATDVDGADDLSVFVSAEGEVYDPLYSSHLRLLGEYRPAPEHALFNGRPMYHIVPPPGDEKNDMRLRFNVEDVRCCGSERPCTHVAAPMLLHPPPLAPTHALQKKDEPPCGSACH